MKKRTFLAIILASLLVCSLGVYAKTVLAAPAPTGNTGQALEIAPPVLTLTADPGQTIKTDIRLRDISNGSLFVTAQINDFVAAGEDGTPKILLDSEGTNPYSIKGWVTPLSDLLMIPKQIKTLSVTINVPINASPGGHYGVIRFTATPPELHGQGVSLSASLGSLVLIKVNGDTKEGLSVQEFSVNHGGKTGTLFETAPLQFVERLKNTGNTHEQPVGQVTITDMFGKKVAAVNINLPPRNILPQSIRKFDQPLDASVLGNKVLFGRYTANLSVTYGANNQVLTSSLVFWVIPYTLIGVSIIALIVGFFGLRLLIRRYNRHIIGKAQGPGRR